MGCLRANVMWLGLAAVGCSAFESRPPSVDDVIHSANEQDAASVHLDLVQTMIEKEQYYAALAHLEQLESTGSDNLGTRSLKGEALRKMGRHAEAEAVYNSLLGTSKEAEGNHGLGLMRARTDVPQAVTHLSAAVRAAPTNPAFRNDLGYAYMLLGRFDLAQVEFTTAMQLDRRDTLSANNLIVLLLIEGRDEDAAALAARAELKDIDWARLKERARGWSSAPG